MPTEQVQHIVRHHRPALVVGTVAGLLLIGGFVAYRLAGTPAAPIVQRASAAEMVEYVSHKRGLASLPDVQQKQFLEDWKRRLNDAAARDDLKSTVKSLDDAKREEFTSAVARQIKKSFLDDAKRFSQLNSPAEKGEFCRQKLTEGRDQAMQFKDIAMALKSSSGKRTDDIQQWVLENTTAEERALGEPYVDALKRVREQVKKEERGATASADKKP